MVGSAPRSVMRRDNLRHLVVAVMVRDPGGRIYVHRRTDTKDVFPACTTASPPGCLQCGRGAGGGSRAGGRPRSSAWSASPLEPLMVMRYEDAATRHVCHAFVATYDGPITHQAGQEVGVGRLE